MFLDFSFHPLYRFLNPLHGNEHGRKRILIPCRLPASSLSLSISFLFFSASFVSSVAVLKNDISVIEVAKMLLEDAHGVLGTRISPLLVCASARYTIW